MTLTPRFDSPDKNKRKLLYYVCSETGRCFPTNESPLAGSVPKKKKVNRLDTDLDLSEMLYGEKRYASE